jgi:hypothetical protein
VLARLGKEAEAMQTIVQVAGAAGQGEMTR